MWRRKLVVAVVAALGMTLTLAAPAYAGSYVDSSTTGLGGGTQYTYMSSPYDDDSGVYEWRTVYNAYGQTSCFGCGANWASVRHIYHASGVLVSITDTGVGFSEAGTTCTSGTSYGQSGGSDASSYYSGDVCEARASGWMSSGYGKVWGGARLGSSWYYLSAYDYDSWPG